MTRKVSCMRTLRAAVLLSLGVGLQPFAAAQEPLQVGESYPLSVDSSRAVNVLPAEETANGLRWVLTHPGGTYIAVHFQDFDLAPGEELIISDAMGGQAYHLTGLGKMDLGTFWAQHVKGDTAVLDLITANHLPHEGFVIDEYAAGFVDLGGPASICGANDFENAACRNPSVEYDRGRAVARLLRNGSALCTGWLVSAYNHLITNEHCITTPFDAANIDYEFGSEAPTCGSGNCMNCWEGTLKISGAAFIQDNPGLDYALVQITDLSNGDPQAMFGYLEIDDRAAIIGEQIYLVGHPNGRAKEFSYYSTGDVGGVGRVLSLTEPSCEASTTLEIGYDNDTEGGSSGSPVIAVFSQKVIALHHCAGTVGCGNRGVPINLICAEICPLLDCGDGVCLPSENHCNCPADCGPPTNEVPGSTCQDGEDDDCDGFADCDDGDCASDAECRCYDNGGNGPLVCVNWAGADPPELNEDFVFDFGTDPIHPEPDVTFRTGNNGWRVWSQVSRTSSELANLGHIKIDPTLPTANFGLTVARGNSPGAVNIASMVLVDSGWTGVSNVAGGSITGNLEGELVLQGTAGTTGSAVFTVEGNVNGNITIPTVDTLDVKGDVSAGSTITLGGFSGNKRAEFSNTRGGIFAGSLSLPSGLPLGAQVIVNGLLTDTAFVDFNGHDLAGKVTLNGGSAAQSSINIGGLVPPSGELQLFDSTYTGSITLNTVESGRVVLIDNAIMAGSIIVDGDWKGELQCLGNFDGTLNISGVLSGNLSASNFSASAALPSIVTISCGIGTSGTLSWEKPVCPPGNIVTSLAKPPHGTRDGRQPYPVGIHGDPVPLSERQGIGSPNPDARQEDKIFMTLSNSGMRAINHDCWTLCETGPEPVDTGTLELSENKISCIREIANPTSLEGDYQIKLERPISAKQWTTIQYVPDEYAPGNTRVIYASLPGSINNDNYVNGTDIIWSIDCVNGMTSHCGSTVYTQDIDRSGLFIKNVDYLIRLSDLWTANGRYIPWQGKSLPANTCAGVTGGGGGSGGGICPVAPCGPDPGPMGMAMAGGGLEGFGEEMLVEEFIEEEPTLAEQNAVIADWVVNFVMTTDPQTAEAEDILDASMGMITQWCVDFFSAEEKTGLAARLSDVGLAFASQAGQSAAAELAQVLAP